MKKLHFVLFLLCTSPMLAHGAGVAAGRTLLESSGARAASLGEAFTGMTNDITALSYNPASLRSLESGQASFQYQKGLADDSYGNFLVGTPLAKGAVGLMVSYYNGGSFDAWDGSQTKSINAKKDMTAALGYGWQWGKLNFGLSGKYISSTLVETTKATAFAGDAGFQLGLTKGLIIGGAIQNIGSQMTYVHESATLPRIGRVGLAWKVPLSKVTMNFLADAPYYMTESQLKPAVGAEAWVGPLALRVGYRTNSDLQGLSFGAGFLLGQASIDYSYGLVQDLQTTQRVSVSLKFGEPQPNQNSAVQFSSLKPQRHTLQQLSQVQFSSFKPVGRKVYVVQRGDNLEKISKAVYGDGQYWRKILSMNPNIERGPYDLVPGQKVMLP